MATTHPTWTHDPTEPFSPPVYRRGVWHFQAHPAMVIIFLTLWFDVLAMHLPAPFQAVVLMTQLTGFVLGAIMTVFIAGYHLVRYHERKNYMPHMTPYTIGILEHLSAVAFVVLVAQMIGFVATQH